MFLFFWCVRLLGGCYIMTCIFVTVHMLMLFEYRRDFFRSAFSLASEWNMDYSCLSFHIWHHYVVRRESGVVVLNQMKTNFFLEIKVSHKYFYVIRRSFFGSKHHIDFSIIDYKCYEQTKNCDCNTFALWCLCV